MQTFRFLQRFSKRTDLRSTLIVGGESLESQFAALSQNPDIVVATVGRFVHHVVEVGMGLQRVEMVIFDEADRLFEMGFRIQLGTILEKLPSQRQTVLLSATLPSQLLEFSRSGLQDPELVRLEDDVRISDRLQQTIFSVRSIDDKVAALLFLLTEVIDANDLTAIFVPTRHHAEYIASLLRYHLATIMPLLTSRSTPSKGKRGHPEQSGTKNGDRRKGGRAKRVAVNQVAAMTTKSDGVFEDEADAFLGVSILYSSMDQRDRTVAMNALRSGQSRIMVVTDIAARGMDIPDLDNVINFNVPHKTALFIHRVGRVARNNRSGCAYTLVSGDEWPYLLDIHTYLGRKLIHNVTRSVSHAWRVDEAFLKDKMLRKQQSVEMKKALRAKTSKSGASKRQIARASSDSDSDSNSDDSSDVGSDDDTGDDRDDADVEAETDRLRRQLAVNDELPCVQTQFGKVRWCPNSTVSLYGAMPQDALDRFREVEDGLVQLKDLDRKPLRGAWRKYVYTRVNASKASYRLAKDVIEDELHPVLCLCLSARLRRRPDDGKDGGGVEAKKSGKGELIQLDIAKLLSKEVPLSVIHDTGKVSAGSLVDGSGAPMTRRHLMNQVRDFLGNKTIFEEVGGTKEQRRETCALLNGMRTKSVHAMDKHLRASRVDRPGGGRASRSVCAEASGGHFADALQRVGDVLSTQEMKQSLDALLGGVSEGGEGGHCADTHSRNSASRTGAAGPVRGGGLSRVAIQKMRKKIKKDKGLSGMELDKEVERQVAAKKKQNERVQRLAELERGEALDLSGGATSEEGGSDKEICLPHERQGSVLDRAFGLGAGDGDGSVLTGDGNYMMDNEEAKVFGRPSRRYVWDRRAKKYVGMAMDDKRLTSKRGKHGGGVMNVNSRVKSTGGTVGGKKRKSRYEKWTEKSNLSVQRVGEHENEAAVKAAQARVEFNARAAAAKRRGEFDGNSLLLSEKEYRGRQSKHMGRAQLKSVDQVVKERKQEKKKRSQAASMPGGKGGSSGPSGRQIKKNLSRSGASKFGAAGMKRRGSKK